MYEIGVTDLILSIWQSPYVAWSIVLLMLFIGALNRLSDTVSSMQVLKSKVLLPLAARVKFNRLHRAAIKSDVEGNVNQVVDEIKNELPDGWAQPLSVKWVIAEDKAALLSDEQAVIRIKPVDNEGSNFARAVYFYFKRCFFPQTHTALDEAHVEAVTLQFSNRVIKESKPEFQSQFEDEVLEPTIVRLNKVSKYLERLGEVDKRGLFTGVFIREVDEIANKSRFTERRDSLGSEFTQVLKHLEEFLAGYRSPGVIEDYQWVRHGPVCSYGLILVADSFKARHGAINGYVNRAKERAVAEIDHLYIFGTAKERRFAEEVIGAIQVGVPEYKLAETFELYKDYRGKKGGTGALFLLR